MYRFHHRLIGIVLLLGSLVMIYAPIHAQDTPWGPIGPGISTSGTANNAALAIAPDGAIYIAMNSEVYRFNGTVWESIRESLISGPGDCKLSGMWQNSRLAVGPDSIPYLAWIHSTGNDMPEYVYVCRFNGMYWEQVGSGSATGTGLGRAAAWSNSPDITIDSLNRLYVVWASPRIIESAPTDLLVRRFNGTNWEEVGVGSADATTGGISQGECLARIGHPDIDLDVNDTPYVAWVCAYYAHPNQAFIRRFNGTIWEEITPGSASYPYGISHSLRQVDHVELEIGPGGEPYVVWQQAMFNGSWEIYIKRFNGVEWEEVGVGSASGGGISNTLNNGSNYPSLAFTGDGTPYVTWTEDTRQFTQPEHFTLWIRRFNGTSWEEIYPGSASYEGEGVDDNFNEEIPSSLESDALGQTFATYARDTASGGELSIRSLQYSTMMAAPEQQYYRVPNPVLTWRTVSWALGYAIEIDDSPDFSSPSETNYALSSDTHSYVPSYLRNGTYYWRVSARVSETQLGRWSAPTPLIVNLP
jgi:hypothetical protein